MGCIGCVALSVSDHTARLPDACQQSRLCWSKLLKLYSPKHGGVVSLFSLWAAWLQSVPSRLVYHSQCLSCAALSNNTAPAVGFACPAEVVQGSDRGLCAGFCLRKLLKEPLCVAAWLTRGYIPGIPHLPGSRASCRSTNTCQTLAATRHGELHAAYAIRLGGTCRIATAAFSAQGKTP